MSQSEPQPAMESEDALAPAGVGQAASYAGRMGDKRVAKADAVARVVANIVLGLRTPVVAARLLAVAVRHGDDWR